MDRLKLNSFPSCPICVLLATVALAVIVITAAVAECKEVMGRPSSSGDWTYNDRIRFEMLSGGSTQKDLEASPIGLNTFVAAARHNTRTLAPREYVSLKERNTFYDLASLDLALAPAD